jgi:SAM-dependent methyltransferase
MSAKEFSQTEIKDAVKSRYAKAIQGSSSCCGPSATQEGTQSSSCCGPTAVEQKGNLVKIAGYDKDDLSRLPADAVQNSFGCGTPLAFAGVQSGQVVLDIGSGAGIDCFIAAEKVGPTGKVIGLDMTPEMIEAAKKNAAEAGAANVEFRLGDAEDMPVDSGTVDWIISNCVINLAPDKAKVFREAYRVLRPGGKILVSDIVTHDLPQNVRRSLEAWAFCVAGSLEEDDYLDAIREAGFSGVQIVARIDYDEETISAIACETESIPDELARLAPSLAGKVSSIKFSAVKA